MVTALVWGGALTSPLALMTIASSTLLVCCWLSKRLTRLFHGRRGELLLCSRLNGLELAEGAGIASLAALSTPCIGLLLASPVFLVRGWEHLLFSTILFALCCLLVGFWAVMHSLKLRFNAVEWMALAGLVFFTLQAVHLPLYLLAFPAAIFAGSGGLAARAQLLADWRADYRF